MAEHKNRTPQWGKRNWLSLAIIGLLSWLGVYYWEVMLDVSPYLVIVHSFLLYLFVVKLFYDNCSSFNKLFVKMRDGGWVMIKVMVGYGVAILRKCAFGIGLVIRRVGVEQELIIAEKRKKKLEIELSQKELYAKLVQPSEPVLPEKSSLTEINVAEIDEKREQIPPYAKYGPILMEYLEQVRWERFTISQAQLILHKRFGTVKLVLEELVHQQKLEYVKTGKRTAYRPVNYGK